jgi:hypothetical protein
MKNLFVIITVVSSLFASSCGQAPGSNPQCTTNWSCGNAACASSLGSWSGSGTFTGSNDESDCLAWQTLFLNGTGYPYNRVSSCSCQ